MLSVNNINFFYDEVQILSDITISVAEGEFVALFGPNGHGKSTLLKTICGLLTPSSGIIEYNGQNIIGIHIKKIVERGLTYIAEDKHLFPEMTVIDNLKMGAYNKNAREKESDNLEYVFYLFPKLQKLSTQLASALSGGEARMLAIGRGLMSNPKFLAIDEPSFGLAPNLRFDVFEAINDIQKNRKLSILLVEQSTSIACDYADRIYILEDGKIALEGTKDELMNNNEIKKLYLGL